MAVRNAVSAATNTFAAISKILFFIIASFFYVTQISLISQKSQKGILRIISTLDFLMALAANHGD